MRFQRLSNSAWLQTGAELRYRADAADQPVFGLRGVKDDSYLMQRAQVHVDLHLLDDSLRTFIQLQNNRTWCKDLPSPSDQSRNEIQQAFMTPTANVSVDLDYLLYDIGSAIESTSGNNSLLVLRSTFRF